jgi:long-chain fatty acid transport protein
MARMILGNKQLLVALILFFFLPALAIANPEETFGVGARAIGAGGALTSVAKSYDATFYNPAALTRVTSPELGLGFFLYRPFFEISNNNSDANKTQFLLNFGFASNFPLPSKGKDLLFIGLNLSLPPNRLYSIQALPSHEPHFVFFETRNRRLAVDFAIALKLHRIFSVGAGFSILPNISGDVKVDFTKGDNESRLLVDVKPKLSPNAGVLVNPYKGLFVALSWRGANKSTIDIPVSVYLQQLPPIDLQIQAWEYSTPHTITFGAGYDFGKFLVALDFSYYFFRDFYASVPTVTLYGAQGTSSTSSTMVSALHDSIALRIGGEAKVMKPLTLRSGFSFVQSPVPAQEDVSNMLDCNRFTLSLGASLDVPYVPELSTDLAFSYTYLVKNHDEKMVFAPQNKGYPNISYGGHLVAFGMTLRYRF